MKSKEHGNPKKGKEQKVLGSATTMRKPKEANIPQPLLSAKDRNQKLKPLFPETKTTFSKDCEPAVPLQSPEMGNLGNTLFGTQKGTFGGPLEPFK